MTLKFLLCFFLMNLGLVAYAATKNDPHAPITHCYHWLDQSSKNYLSFKYTFAKTNGNELTFFTSASTSNGSVAGPGLYCGKTPADSFSYGDRVIRVDLVDDVVLLDSLANIQYCGSKGETSQNSPTCAQKTWDIKFYSGGGVGNIAWYVIQNPMAIQSWSANSDQVEADLKLNATMNDASFQAKATQTIQLMNLERAIMSKQTFQNLNARASIIDIILKDPGKLDSIPPLNIMTRVLGDSSGKLSQVEKIDIYKRFTRRSMGSNDTEYSELAALAVKSPDIKTALLEAVADGLKTPEKQNPFVLLGVLSGNENYFKDVPDQVYQTLINRVLSNKDLMLQLAGSKIVFSDKIKSMGLSSIKSMQATPYDFKNPNTVIVPSVLKYFGSNSEIPKLKADWKSYIFSSKKEDFGISIGSENYYLNPAVTDIKSQCQIAMTLSASDQAQDLSLLFSNQKVKLGQTITANSQLLCQQIETLIKSISVNKFTNSNLPLTFITGRIETTPFFFVGQYSDDIKSQCVALYPTVANKQNVDEIFTSVNGKAEFRSYNSSSYWTTQDSVCDTISAVVGAQLLSKAQVELKNKTDAFINKNKDLKKASPAGYLVEGSIQGVDYAFFGNDVDEVYNQCLSFYDLLPSKGSIDTIYWKVGNSVPAKIYNTKSYWKTPDEVCTQMKSGAIAVVPSKNKIFRDALSLKWAALKKNNDGFEVKGRFETANFTFYGLYREDIMLQCSEFYDYLDLKDMVDDIYVSVNGSAEVRQNNSQSFWRTKAEACGAFEAAISLTVPSKAESVLLQKKNLFIQKYEALAKASTVKGYLVKGRIETMGFVFYGQARDEISDQCNEFYDLMTIPKNSIDEIYVSVNGSVEQRKYNSSSFWKSKDEVCATLIATISQSVPSVQEIQLAQKKAQFVQKYQALAKNANDSGFTVRGTIETSPYLFFGNTQAEIMAQCTEFYQYVDAKGSVDDITVAVNKNPAQVLRNSANYWSTEQMVCDQIKTVMSAVVPAQVVTAAQAVVGQAPSFQQLLSTEKANFDQNNNTYKVSGVVGQNLFYFYGDNLEGIAKQCYEYELIAPSATISNITFKLQNAATKTIAFNGTAAKFCAGLMPQIELTILSQDEIDYQHDDNRTSLAFQKSKDAFKARVKLGNRILFYSGKNVKGLKKECMNFYPNLHLDSKPATMVWDINGDTAKKATLGSFILSDKNLCKMIEEVLLRN